MEQSKSAVDSLHTMDTKAASRKYENLCITKDVYEICNQNRKNLFINSQKLLYKFTESVELLDKVTKTALSNCFTLYRFCKTALDNYFALDTKDTRPTHTSQKLYYNYK